MSISKVIHRRAFLTVLAFAIGITAQLSVATVPVSVAVRQQAPAVEQIISQLEAKAANATGIWNTKSGRQDSPAEAWQTSLSGEGKNGGSWYWQSLALAPAPMTGLVLFDTGEDAYVLPYGQDNRQGDERFQYDTLRKWQEGDYLLGHYLFHMNLLPRQFIGALGGLKVVGEEPLDAKEGGEKLVHLRADPRDDLLGKADPAINQRYSGGIKHTPVIDFYYSPAKRAIVKAVLSRADDSRQLVLSVTAWDTFGTNDSWAAKLEGRTVVASNAAVGTATVPPKEVAKPVLTSVEKFSAGKDLAFDAVKQRMQSTLFYVTPLMELRTQAFYRQSLENDDNTSDRVALALASFMMLDMSEGLQQWEKVDPKVKTSEDSGRLNEALAPLASAMLIQITQKFAGQSKEERAACAALLMRFTRTLDGDDFKSVAHGAVLGWDSMRGLADTKATIAALTPALLPKLAAHGNVAVIEKLVNLAEAKKEDASLIDPILKGIADQPVPVAGLFLSQQDYLIVATIRAGALERAQGYVEGLRWDISATNAQKQVATLWSSAILAAQNLERGQDGALADAIASHEAFAQIKISDDRTDAVYGPWTVVQGGLDWMNRRIDTEADKPQPVALMAQTAKLPGADKYWGELIAQAAMKSALRPQRLLDKVAPIIQAYAQTFGNPKFESGLWLGLARNQGVAGKYLGVELQYLNKALAAAPDDVTRAQIIGSIGQAYAHANEYAKGADAIEQVSDLITDQKLKDQLANLVTQLKSRQNAANG